MFALGFLAAGAVIARRFEELGKPVGLGLRDDVLGAGRRPRRRARLLPRPELVRRARRPARQHLLRLGAGLVRRRDRRRARRVRLGVVARASCRWCCSTSRRRRWRSATRSAASAASSRATATTARASDLPWAMSYPDGTVPTDEQVHPTPVYETLAMGLIAWLLWQWRDRFRPGVLFAALSGAVGAGAVPGRVHAPQRRHGRRPHDAAGREPRADAGGNGVDRGRQPPAGRTRGTTGVRLTGTTARPSTSPPRR